MSTPSSAGGLDPMRVNLRVRLAGLWASLTLCYLYCDYFELYQAGKLPSMLAGQVGPLGPATPKILLAISIMMAIPALMVALTLLLPPGPCRIANLIFGALFTLIMAMILPKAWLYYQFFATVEILLTGTITWLAWKWPRLSPPLPAQSIRSV